VEKPMSIEQTQIETVGVAFAFAFGVNVNVGVGGFSTLAPCLQV